MSELKHQLMLNKDRSWVPCYLKSEADKVIAHQKYKRCLAMAEICRNEWCTLYYERKKYAENRFLDHLMAKKTDIRIYG